MLHAYDYLASILASMALSLSAKRETCMASTPTRLFSMNMPVPLHRALKRAAVEREKSMGEIVVEALKQWGLEPLEEEDSGSEEDRSRQQ